MVISFVCLVPVQLLCPSMAGCMKGSKGPILCTKTEMYNFHDCYGWVFSGRSCVSNNSLEFKAFIAQIISNWFKERYTHQSVSLWGRSCRVSRQGKTEVLVYVILQPCYFWSLQGGFISTDMMVVLHHNFTQNFSQPTWNNDPKNQ